MRELAIAGARHLAGEPHAERERHERLRRLAESFDEPLSADVDHDALREGKRHAWPVR